MYLLTFNPLFLSAFMGMVVAQLAKFLLILALERRLAWDRISETGGMPSSHSAAVAALTTAIGLTYGVESAYFAISFVFGSVVIYDATGVRRAAGQHAEVLNSLISEMSHLFEEGDSPKALKTLLGHTYPQVFVGTLLGIFIGFVCTGNL
ncbi:MAG: acid phosphatase [Spirochaetaceae bacterium 4572_59]|nr:MAG: acid phosphatase [Spirochaetaceae bacterium 4572_59]